MQAPFFQACLHVLVSEAVVLFKHDLPTKKAVVDVTINGYKAYGLIDTGSSASFINEDTIRKLKVTVFACKVEKVSMGHEYKDVSVSILPDLCSDIIVDHDSLKRHSSLQVTFGGEETPLDICSMAATNVEPAQLFTHLSPNCKPISIKSRRHTAYDLQFIHSEIQNLLKEGIIEKSVSPWRAQVMVVTSENHRHRMAVDYSQTLIRYTELDAFPLPSIDDIVNNVASYNIYSRLDLRNAYYQLKEGWKKFYLLIASIQHRLSLEVLVVQIASIQLRLSFEVLVVQNDRLPFLCLEGHQHVLGKKFKNVIYLINLLMNQGIRLKCHLNVLLMCASIPFT
ncbi:hypothetical protein PR048_000490 [Dryococelus australis]|uniref:Uncharacterized protein n=1 Tax=Dryococelus australis TaxID=614101 RepID=A0ABQ9IG43_9NEOP|nr:hypothetical protein PR048_000490 [Dryococelus australis]